MKNAEYTHKVRVGQVEEATREVKALREENQSLGEINYKLAEDLEACRNHLQNLGVVNSKLVEHLENFSSEDESIRELLNRKPRVEMAQNRVTEISSGKGYYGDTRTSTRREYL